MDGGSCLCSRASFDRITVEFFGRWTQLNGIYALTVDIVDDDGERFRQRQVARSGIEQSTTAARDGAASAIA
jgi:hypothetical protein